MANVFDDFLFEIGAEVAVKGTRGTNTKLSISETLSEAIERQITMAKIDASSYPIEDGRCSLPVLGGRGRPNSADGKLSMKYYIEGKHITKKMALDIGIKTPLERIFNGDCDELNMIIMHYGE